MRPVVLTRAVRFFKDTLPTFLLGVCVCCVCHRNVNALEGPHKHSNHTVLLGQRYPLSLSRERPVVVRCQPRNHMQWRRPLAVDRLRHKNTKVYSKATININNKNIQEIQYKMNVVTNTTCHHTHSELIFECKVPSRR